MKTMTQVLGGTLALLTAFTAMPAFAEPAFATRNVNVRSGPGIEFDSVGQLVKDEPVEKGNCNADKSWCYIRHEGENGWVAAVFLRSATTTTPQPPAQQPAAGDAYRATINVNVRTGPDTTYGVVDRLDSGEQVSRGQCTSDGAWCYVSHDGADGWVSSRFLEPVAPPLSQPPSTPSSQIRIARAEVNVRTGPDTTFTVVDRLDRNERVEVAQCTDDRRWCYVSHDGPDGWVSADFLRTPGSTSQNPGNQNGGNQNPPAPPQQTQTQKIGTAIAGMPVRSSPTLFTSTVGHLDRGDEVPVESCSADGYWCHIVSSSIDGWVPAAFLTITEVQVPVATNTAIAARATPIRRMPGGQSAIIGMLQSGSEVTVNQCGPGGNYCQITRNGLTGWVEADVLQAPPSAPAQPPASQPQQPNSVCFTGFGGVEICLSN